MTDIVSNKQAFSRRRHLQFRVYVLFALIFKLSAKHGLSVLTVILKLALRLKFVFKAGGWLSGSCLNYN